MLYLMEIELRKLGLLLLMPGLSHLDLMTEVVGDEPPATEGLTYGQYTTAN